MNQQEIDYNLTQEKILVKFYNTLFLLYDLAKKLRFERSVLDEMNTQLELIACDTKKFAKDQKLERVPHGYTSPDGKTIILDEGYFNQVLNDFPQLKEYGDDVLQILFDVCYQFWMDHEFLHSYLILSGKAKKIWEKYGKEKYRKKMESATTTLQKKLTAHRTKLYRDEKTKKIWHFWLKRMSSKG